MAEKTATNRKICAQFFGFMLYSIKNYLEV